MNTHPRSRAIPNDIFFEEVGRMLDEGKSVTVSAQGRSMFPFITGGRDTVTLKKQQDVRKGDIVLARAEGKYLLHRVIRISEGRLTLMGDGNVRQKEHCRLTDILGTVSAIGRNGKSVGCSGGAERVKGILWMLLLPVRRPLLWLIRHTLQYKGGTSGKHGCRKSRGR